MFTKPSIERDMTVLKRYVCWMAFAFFILAPMLGQKRLNAQTAEADELPISIQWESTTAANGCQFVHIASDAYASSALALEWTFKPFLEVERAGIGEAWARVLSAQWQSDTIGTGLQFSWNVTPEGFEGYGDAATVSEWGALMLNGLRSSPASNWPQVRDAWMASWDSAYHVPSTIAARVLQTEMFTRRHPYGEQEFPATLAAISEADVQHHAAAYWHPNNGRLVLAGPSYQESIPIKWMDIVSDWPARELKNPALPAPRKPRQNEAFIVESDQDHVYAAAGQLMRLKPDHSDVLPLLILSEHLAAATSDSLAVVIDPLMSSIQFTTNGTAAATITSIVALQSAMADATQSPPNTEALTAWKRKAEVRTQTNLQSPKAAARLFIQRPDWFQAAADTEWEAFTASVQPSDIQRVAINYLRPNNLQIAAVGLRDSARAVAEAFAMPEHLEWYTINAEPKSPFGPAPEGLTASEVIQSHYNACGGESAFEGLNSCRRTGTMEAGGGLVMNVESEEIYGIGHRTAISIDGQVMMEQIVQPGKGLSIKLGKGQVMSTDEYERYEPGLYAAELLSLTPRELTANLVGSNQRLEGQEWVVNLNRDGALVQRLFFDAETHLLIRREEYRSGPTGPSEIFVEYTEYKAFEGLLYATKIIRQTNNQRMVTIFEDVQPNARVNKNQFEWE